MANIGSELIGCSLWELLPPGEAAYPDHFHYSDEEMVIVPAGRPTLRTPEGEREGVPGEAVRFPLGEDGAPYPAEGAARLLPPEDAVPYWEGEEPPADPRR